MIFFFFVQITKSIPLKKLQIIQNSYLIKLAIKAHFLRLSWETFNARPSNWYEHDKTTHEGFNINAVTSKFGLQELIKESIQTLGKSSSCIDLILTSHSNLVMESGVHVFLYSNCLHHIIYATIHLLTNVNYGTISRLLTITSERQSNTFLETCHLKIQTLRNGILFNRPIKNILSNYILHEIIICDNKDPTWVYNRIKELINEKNDIFENYLRSNMDPKSFNKFHYLQNELNFLSETNKKKELLTYLEKNNESIDQQ